MATLTRFDIQLRPYSTAILIFPEIMIYRRFANFYYRFISGLFVSA